MKIASTRVQQTHFDNEKHQYALQKIFLPPKHTREEIKIILSKAVLRYNVIIIKENKDYVAYVPKLGISDFGKTVEEAKRNVQGAIECHLEGLIKTNSEIPAPDTKDYYLSQSEVVVSKKIMFAI